MDVEFVDAYLRGLESVSHGFREFLRFCGSALIPLCYLWVTAFRGRERVAMLCALVVQALVLVYMDPAGKGEWVRFPVLLGMSTNIDAEDAGMGANAGFGALYLVLLARCAVLGRVERGASGAPGRASWVAGWIEDHLRRGGRWVAVVLLAAVAWPVL